MLATLARLDAPALLNAEESIEGRGREPAPAFFLHSRRGALLRRGRLGHRRLGRGLIRPPGAVEGQDSQLLELIGPLVEGYPRHLEGLDVGCVGLRPEAAPLLEPNPVVAVVGQCWLP